MAAHSGTDALHSNGFSTRHFWLPGWVPEGLNSILRTITKKLSLTEL